MISVIAGFIFDRISGERRFVEPLEAALAVFPERACEYAVMKSLANARPHANRKE